MDDASVAALMSSRFDDHDIFLSHSGKQKGFVTDLYKMLHSKGYTAFFDVTHHSLPPGSIFPALILDAVARCRLAVVVLSHDFLLSKWPMIELCAFVQAQSSSTSIIKILPVFYKLSPTDLKLKQNLQKWRKAWKAYAKSDPKRIDVEKWENALHNLSKHQGVIFDPSRVNGGEPTYMQDILLSITKVVKPMIEHDMSGIQGKERLCKIIFDKFQELESSRPPPPTHNTPSAPSQSSTVSVLGMYGLPGSGKSTLSKCLCNHFIHEFHGRTFYLQLPANPTNEQLVKVSKDLLKKVTNFFNRVDLDIATELSQIYSLLERHLQSFCVFLVMDNITPEPLTIEFVQRILMCNFRAGSKLLLVARTLGVLRRLLIQDDIREKCIQEVCKYAYGSIEVPSINKEEAIQVLVQNAGSGRLPESCAPVDESDLEIIGKVIDMSSFVGKKPEYLPLVVKIMGSQLRDYSCRSYVEEWHNHMESFWKKVQLCKEEAVMQLVQGTFDELPERLRFLFLDVALFILPSSYGSPLRILSLIHDRPRERIEMDMVDLQRRCFLENVEWNHLRFHDVFLQFAASRPESFKYYLRSSRHDGIFLPRELPPPPEEARIFGLRAVVVELHEGQERFDIWEEIPSVKALVVRHSRSLTVLGLPVGLKSLTSLDIDNCPNFTYVELVGEDKSVLDSVASLTWNNNKSRSIVSVPITETSSNEGIG